MLEYSRFLIDDSATQRMGQTLAKCLQPPLFISLSGPLGAGKTALIRALLRQFGVTGPIKSPTYALVEPYAFSNFSIYHFDFYRFLDHNEWEESGFRDYFEQNAICLVEWPEKAQGLLPVADLSIELAYSQEGRHIVMVSHSERGHRIIEQLKKQESE